MQFSGLAIRYNIYFGWEWKLRISIIFFALGWPNFVQYFLIGKFSQIINIYIRIVRLKSLNRLDVLCHEIYTFMKWMKKSPRFRTTICGSNKVLFHVQIEPTILITVKIDEVIAQFTTSPIQSVLRWYDRIAQVYTVTIQVILLYYKNISWFNLS